VGIGIDGIATGIDTTALIGAMTEAASGPKNALETRIDDYEDKKEKISELINLIGDMEDALEDIEDIGDFRSFKASYEENDAFDVSVDGEAVAGTYDITVGSIAKAELEISQGYASQTTDGVVGTGTISVDYGGTTSVVTVTSDMNLAEVASEIDDIDGVTAYIMDTGDATTPYRLVIQGDDAGGDNTITVTDTLTGGTAPSFTESVSAADAKFTINGIAVEADSNTVTDAVPGMTINLSEITTETITVTVAPDPEAIEAKIQTFADAFNAIVSFVDTNSVFDSEAGLRGPFVGESSVGRVVEGLRSVIASEFTDLGQDYDALSIIGITTDSNGKLEIDSDTLQDLLNDEATEIANLFTGTGGFIEGMLAAIDVYTDPTEGSLAIRQDSLEDRIVDMEDQVEVYERRIERMTTRLRNQFTGLESLVGSLNGSGQYITAMLAQSLGTA
jgi:flagellar hook-associated protein 2